VAIKNIVAEKVLCLPFSCSPLVSDDTDEQYTREKLKVDATCAAYMVQFYLPWQAGIAAVLD